MIREILESNAFPTSVGVIGNKKIRRAKNYKNNSVLMVTEGGGRGSKKFLKQIADKIEAFLKAKTDIKFNIEFESGREPSLNVEFSEHFDASDMSNITTSIQKFIGDDIIYSSMSI